MRNQAAAFSDKIVQIPSRSDFMRLSGPISCRNLRYIMPFLLLIYGCSTVLYNIISLLTKHMGISEVLCHFLSDRGNWNGTADKIKLSMAKQKCNMFS